MNLKTYKTTSPKETTDIGISIAQKLTSKDVVLFEGNLGAGKTTMIQEMIRYFGIKEHVTSPTFSIMNIYELDAPKQDISIIIHIDAYRMEHPDEALEIGLQDYIGAKNIVCFIEWPKKLGSLLESIPNKKTIKIEHDGQDNRIITLEA